jgi:trimethylamine--corrinoid protein Co-methyltransferase
MRVNQATRAGTRFQLLSPDQLARIHRAALRILDETGADVHEAESLAVLRDLGARVDGARVRLPAPVVDDAIRRAPSSFVVHSRSGRRERALELAPNQVHYGPGPTAPNFLDPRTGRRRRYVRADAAAVARVCDALDGIGFVQSLGTVSDVPPDLADVHEFAAMIRNTDKPIVSWSYTLETCRVIHRIAQAVAGGAEALRARPNYVFYAEPLSPLTSTREAAEKLVYCARHRIPLVYTPCPMSGGTAPATCAGVLAMALAESLAGLVVAQAIAPGTPFVIGGVVSVIDMKTSVLAYGAPELSLLSAGLTELGRHLGLPVWSTGGCTDSKTVDEQAAAEGALSALFAGLSGANLVHDVGYVESGMTGSLEQLVLMDEAIGWTRRVARGIDVRDETLAVDVVDRVGPGGQFLDDEHTYRHFKSEFWFPSLFDRRRWSEWNEAGRPTGSDRVRARVAAILEGHRPEPLGAAAEAEIDLLLEEAEHRLTAHA